MAIDQTKVDGMPLDTVRKLTVGPEDTFCTVQILRGDRCSYTYIHARVFHLACVNSLREHIRYVFFNYGELNVVERASSS